MLLGRVRQEVEVCHRLRAAPFGAAVMPQGYETSVMPGGVVRVGRILRHRERVPGRPGESSASVRTARGSRVVPHLANGRVLHRRLRLTHRPRRDVAHRVTDLPFRLLGTFEDRDVLKVRLQKPGFVIRIRTGRIRRDRVIERRPPYFVRSRELSRVRQIGTEFVARKIRTEAMAWIHPIVIVPIHGNREANLVQIGSAARLFGRSFGLREHRKKDRRENRDDRNDDK